MVRRKLCVTATAIVASAALNSAATEPIDQISLSLTANAGEMAVTWITYEPYRPSFSGSVTYWSDPLRGKATANATAWTYTVDENGGWNGTIYFATMTDLTPATQYTYTLDGNGLATAPRSFTSAPVASPDAETLFAVTADFGSVELSGFLVAAEIIREHAIKPFDLALVAGDLSYATVHPPNHEWQGLWDAWGRQNEPFTSTAPWMTTPGNHESTPGNLTNASGTYPQRFAAFAARYGASMPRNGDAGFHFSYSYGAATFVSVNSEDDYSVGSPQWLWANATLAAVNRSETPWLFFVLHRPILCSDTSEETSHIPGAPLSAAWEPLLLTWGVDVVLQGHMHCYERSAAQFNGTVVQRSDVTGTYRNPGAPVYIEQGTSGAVLDMKGWMKPQPAWSEVRTELYYGFGRLGLSATPAAFTLAYDFVDKDGVVRDHFSIVKTRK